MFSDEFRTALKAAEMTLVDFSNSYKVPYNTAACWQNGFRQPPEWSQSLIIESLQNRAKKAQKAEKKRSKANVL